MAPSWGWKGALLGPAAVSLALAVVLQVGLSMATRIGNTDKHAATSKAQSGQATPSAVPFAAVLTMRSLLLLGTSYLFVSVVRVGLATWLPVYLKSERVRAWAAVCNCSTLGRLRDRLTCVALVLLYSGRTCTWTRHR